MSDMDKMQADAVNRAREMYSRRSPSYSAGGFPSGYNGNMKANPNITPERNSQSGNFSMHSHTKHSETEPEPETKPEKNNSPNLEIPYSKENAAPENLSKGQSMDFLDTILADKEKALIILLIALLNEEKASSSLLLALMYLII